jgi:cell division protein FtsN
MVKDQYEVRVLMVDHPKKQEKRYYFRRGQIVMLSLGFTITAAFIYFLGLLTGIQMAERMPVKTDGAPARIAVEPLGQAADSTPGAPVEAELASHSEVPKSSSSRPPQQDKLQEDPQLEQVAKVEISPMVPNGKKSKSTVEAESLQKADEKTSARSAQQDETSPSGRVMPKTTAGLWTIQVNSFPDEASAVVWENALKTKGYDAYTMKAVVKEKSWYRVRVGHFASQNEAEALRKVMVSREGFRDAFLARQQESDVIISAVKSQ